MPFLQSNKPFRELIDAYQTQSCYASTDAALEDLGAGDSLRKFYHGRTDFVHQDEIDNFTSKLFPIDYEREQA